MATEWLLDNGYLPELVIRKGIRIELKDRLNSIAGGSLEEASSAKMALIDSLRSRTIAENVEIANKEHYEVDTMVFEHTLGKRMKYSACYYPTLSTTLDEAEIFMLEKYVERAQLSNGQSILDLGCGWGSCSLYFAKRFPGSEVTGLSNSRTQKEYIDAEAKRQGIMNLTIVTANVATHEFDPASFDRVVSIEMFEHMKNYEKLMGKVNRWLKSLGKLFVHIFAHREFPYEYGSDGWMGKYFFNNGNMPSADLLLYFQRDLKIENQWYVNGNHYARTCEDWLKNLNKSKSLVLPSLAKTYGAGEEYKWFYRWQVFYLACAELFAWQGGDTWGVYHYLFIKSA
ncbi:uncharacterized protein LAJ45_00553 [Morchella importuna]|uniref:uncharacterized protein n=1 Tax=Morchella importuna TaxID=1174673 RepID=UPI001E8D5C6D|nr:uncharacterized protein LAJ45_00553 [Morchella importuna]KAH8155543.1 hypothetical protein LAJ45_00553 [Morchella importuna]